MDPKKLMAWTQVGLQLVTVLGVPLAQVMQFIRSHSGITDDAVLGQLEQLWRGAVEQIEGRIAELRQQAQ
jgi:hypothetical protein